jgi:hypothetical protein
MKWSPPIHSEKEFQEWLASVLQAERERLLEAAAVHESPNYASFEVTKEKYNEGDTAS